MVEMSGGSVTGVEWVFVGVAQPDLTLSIMPEMINYRIVIKLGIQRVQELLDQKRAPLFVNCLIAVSLEGLFIVLSKSWIPLAAPS